MSSNKYSNKWLLQKELVFKKTQGRCSYCGCTIQMDNFHIDHIVSKSYYNQNRAYFKEEGLVLDSINNLTPSCPTCNVYKSHKSIEDFREYIETQIVRIRDRFPGFRLAEKYNLISAKEQPIVFYFENPNQ